MTSSNLIGFRSETPFHWHSTDYLADAAETIFNGKEEHKQRTEWFRQRCHEPKHIRGAAGRLLTALTKTVNDKYTKNRQDILQKAIAYFSNQAIRMDCAPLVKQALPIGSGVTEAACKMIVKQRLCQSV